MLGGYLVQGQTAAISKPTVTGTPVCGGSSVELTFTITNGNNWNKHFSKDAVYEIYDELGPVAYLTRTFAPGVAPSGDDASLTFTIVVDIPNDPVNYPSSTNYRFYVEEPDQNVASPHSNYFTISNPTLSFTGDTKICKGETFNIAGNLTGIGAKDVVVRNSLNEIIGSGSFSDAFNFSRTIDTTTTYYFEVTDQALCTIYEELTIQVLDVIHPEATNSGAICIGGTLDLYASSISGATYSWTGPNGYTSTAQNPSITNATAAMAGTYSVVATVDGCSSQPATTIVAGSVAADSETTAGTDSWVGHVYEGTDFNTYAGNYTETESFDSNYGGDTNCFEISANSEPISIYTETFSVRYRMNSLRNGLYVVDLGSDDGSRLSIDGSVVYNNWTDQAYSTKPGVLMSLNGNSDLTYEFYENWGGNRVSFGNIFLVLENQLTENIKQEVCSGGAVMEISGDEYGGLPNGILLSGTGYQWSYSTSPDGIRTDIEGAISATFTPDVTTAPFNNAGTYYIFRKADLISANNTGYTFYTATHESNSAILNINQPISNNTISRGERGTICATETETRSEITELTITAPEGSVFKSVEFASWGTPEGTCGSFSKSACHSAMSQSVVEAYLLGKNSATIPLSNEILGDPCPNLKRLYIEATYGPPEEYLCSGDEPYTIIGSTPADGVNPVYLWETSVTGQDSGFSAGPGTNNTKDYVPGPLSQTTWMRRQVTNSCGADVSNVVEVKVNVPTAELSGSMEICAGETVDLTASFTGNGPWDFTLDSGGTSSSYLGVQSPYIISVNPSVTTSYTITSITDAAGCSSGTNSNKITVTVKEGVFWTGTTSTDWNTTSNWECNVLPTTETDVLIPSGITNYPLLSAGAIGKARNIDIASGASFQIIGNELQIAGTISNLGSFTADEGTVSMVGKSSQTIPAGTFVGNKINNLVSNNPTDVTLGGVLYLTGIMRVTQGTFFSGGFLTLISNDAQTALIDGSGAGEVSGTVTMQRYLDNSFGYKYFSSPFQNSVVGDFAAYVDLNESFPNFYRYNENRKDINGNDATGWEILTDTTAVLNNIEGYALNFGDSILQKTVEINGTVNNGSYSRTLHNNNGEYTTGFNLVGNPYPSPIDWNAASGWTKTNVDDAIYFFTAGTTDRYMGTYSSYVNGIQSGEGKSSNIIPSMQGFFVHVSDLTADDSPTNAILGMTNEVRINDFSQDFLKTHEKAEHSLIRITAGYENEEKHDPTVVYFVPNASHKFEKELDAHKLMNTAVNVPDFYSLTPNRDKLAISAISNSMAGEPERIPLGIRAEKAGAMVITLKDAENLSSGAHLYLVDEEKRIVQDLNADPVYLFQASKGENNFRFYLVFTNTRISDPAVIFNEPFSVETNYGQVLVRMNLNEGERGPLQISTVTGQIINVLEVAEKEVVEVHGIISTGVYFISYLSGKETFTKKVLVKK